MLGSARTALCSLPPLGQCAVGLSVSRRVFLNELTDFGRGSDDITGTALALPAVWGCAARLTRDAENTEFFEARKGDGGPVQVLLVEERASATQQHPL